MTTSKGTLRDPMSRSHLHGGAQRKVLIAFSVLALAFALVLIPLLLNPELRLDIFREAGFVTSNTGELVAGEDSGATLVVLPTVHEVEGSARPQLRFLAAFISWPEGGGMRLEPLNGGGHLTIPLSSYDHLSSSPDGGEMYMLGPEGAVLIDVRTPRVIAELDTDEVPPVSWDWETATWQQRSYICDRVSNTATWIGCFQRPTLSTWLAGDWQLNLVPYGAVEGRHEVMRGLGFQPIIGFTADDAWLYVYNEYGIRRFDVAEVTSS
jgi:hypothetical protein